jgi:hypothetical protein
LACGWIKGRQEEYKRECRGGRIYTTTGRTDERKLSMLKQRLLRSVLGWGLVQRVTT